MVRESKRQHFHMPKHAKSIGVHQNFINRRGNVRTANVSGRRGEAAFRPLHVQCRVPTPGLHNMKCREVLGPAIKISSDDAGLWCR